MILGNSVLLTQIAKEQVCFVVIIVIITVVGIVSGAIRTLQRIGWLCNLAVWCNIANFAGENTDVTVERHLLTFAVIMAASANGRINYRAVFHSTSLPKVIKPVLTFASQPPPQYQQAAPGFASAFGAVSTMVYAYSGALLFVAFMAEMRHPMDFWKGMLCAQCFICFTYLLFGAFVYGHWGQYAIFNINQGKH